MAIIEDQWVDWEGIEPPIAFPNFEAHYVSGGLFYRTWGLKPNILKALIRDSVTLAADAYTAGDALAAVFALTQGLRETHDYLQSLTAAVCTNKYRGITDTPTGEGIMTAWLEQAGIMTP